MTLMCPNCNRHFPMAGCCNKKSSPPLPTMQANGYDNNNRSNFETPLAYNQIPEYFTNLPTIINTPPPNDESQRNNNDNLIYKNNLLKINSDYQSTSTNDFTNGTITVTPSIQSGGCLIQTTDSSASIKASKIAIRPNLSGGGCVVQNNYSINKQQSMIDENICLTDINFLDDNKNFNEIEKMWMMPMSNDCQELQGSGKFFTTNESLSSCPSFNYHYNTHNHHRREFKKTPDCPNDHHKQFSSNCYSASKTNFYHGNSQQCLPSISSSSSCDNSLQIQVNATVQLPINISECTVNITATTTTTNSDSFNNTKKNTKNLHNFNGGGIVQNDDNINDNNCEENEDCDDSPIIPISCLMPCSWIFNTDWQNNNYSKISDIKNLLSRSGWYYEELSSQQSENLLKNTKIGTWLMRNSSDNRYTFAVSVQTTRGPTSVRVLWIFNKFRLDAEPGIAIKMPLFDCPVKMLEYYIDYSKKNDDKSNVWIDSSGKVYSQIYLSQPLSKEVKSLSHLARLAINKNKISINNLPSPIKNYIDEYPYTF